MGLPVKKTGVTTPVRKGPAVVAAPAKAATTLNRTVPDKDTKPPYHVNQWGKINDPHWFDVRLLVPRASGEGHDCLFVAVKGDTPEKRAEALKTALLRIANMREAIAAEYLKFLNEGSDR